MKTFTQVLTFSRSATTEIVNNKPVYKKTANFLNKKGEKVEITTSDNRIIPGFRYVCKLLPSSGNKFSIEKFFLVKDKIEIQKIGTTVEVLLDGEPIKGLGYDSSINVDFSKQLEQLEAMFTIKTLQLANKTACDAFANEFYKACSDLAKKEFKANRVK